MRVWERRTGALLDSHDLHDDSVRAVAATAVGRVVSCSRTATVDWQLGRSPSLISHPRGVAEVAVSPDGEVVVT
ncbi:MAG: hypothetical protein ACRDQ0_09500, partial [Pseudonocardia sp.]